MDDNENHELSAMSGTTTFLRNAVREIAKTHPHLTPQQRKAHLKAIAKEAARISKAEADFAEALAKIK